MSFRFWTGALGAAAFSLTFATPGRASADDVGFAMTFFVSFTIGDQPAVGVGTDFRMIGFLAGAHDSCSTDPRAGVGPFAQVAWLVPDGARFSAGVHGGGELVAETYALDAELGWTYRTPHAGKPGGHGILVGLQQLVFPVSVATVASFDWTDGAMKPEGTLAIGGGYPQLYLPRSQCFNAEARRH